MRNILEVNNPVRNQKPLNRLVGKFGEYSEFAENILGVTAKNRAMKVVFAIVGGVAVLSGAYLALRNKSSNKLDKAA